MAGGADAVARRGSRTSVANGSAPGRTWAERGELSRPPGCTDSRPLADYDEDTASRVFVHLCSAAQWTAITGEVRPRRRSDRDAYVEAGLPWFDYYDADATDLAHWSFGQG